MAAARSFSSGVLSSVAGSLVSGAPAASEWAGALVSARAALRAAVSVAPVPFVLPASLACLPGVRVSEAVEVVSFRFVDGGVVVRCSDDLERTCLWSTVSRFRGPKAAAKAREWFSGMYHPMTYETSTWRFVSVGGWSTDSWFAAVVRV